jgi:hypothetical protein
LDEVIVILVRYKYFKYANTDNYTRLNSVKFGKHNNFSLFYANNAMQHDWMARGNRDNGWSIENEAGEVVKFDIRISTTTSCIWCGYIKRIKVSSKKELVAAAPVNALVAAPAAPSKPIKMPIMKVHDLLGHGDQEKTKATTIAFGWTICRDKCRCVHCAKAKAKRKNIPKNAEHEKAATPGGRIFTDITSIRKPKNDPKALFVSKPHTRILVDEATNNIRVVR